MHEIGVPEDWKIPAYYKTSFLSLHYANVSIPFAGDAVSYVR